MEMIDDELMKNCQDAGFSGFPPSSLNGSGD